MGQGIACRGCVNVALLNHCPLDVCESVFHIAVAEMPSFTQGTSRAALEE